MGQSNSNRISHDVDALPNFYRDDQLRKILNDIDEEFTGAGWTEVLYNGVFVDSIIGWDSDSKNYKLTQTDFVYTGVFVTGISKTYYLQDGTAVTNVTAVLTYGTGNKVESADVSVTRL